MSQSPHTALPPRRTRRIWVWVIGVIAGLFVIIQFFRFFIPDLRLDNPPVTQTIAWDSPETEQLFRQACADCHSNETVYPWYSYVAPVGWLIAHDTHEGRSELNISVDRGVEWDEMIEEIEEGEMPLPIYTMMHPEAKLSAAQREALMNGIRATFR